MTVLLNRLVGRAVPLGPKMVPSLEELSACVFRRGQEGAYSCGYGMMRTARWQPGGEKLLKHREKNIHFRKRKKHN